MKKNFLLVFAHPDDESFLSGGTIPKYVDAGWKVDFICATKGEAGECHVDQGSSELGTLRQGELAEAAKILGISSVSFLEYVDGTLKEIEPGEVEEKLYQKLLEFEPDVVVTFEPGGVSNHPDHIKLSLSTTFAFQKYAKFVVKGQILGKRDSRRKFVDKLGGYTSKEEPKLYYACMPESVASHLLAHDVLPKESFGKPWKGVPDKIITTVIDISQYTGKKVAALAKHKTQRKNVERFLSIDSQPLAYKEYYILRMQGEQEVFMGKDDEVTNEL